MERLLLKILLFALFASCVGEEKSAESVRVQSSGVFTPISFSIDGREVGGVFDLGEYVTGSDARAIRVKVKNNTRFPMTDMDFVYPERTTKSYGFYSEEGEGEYPGQGGTCGQTLEPNKQCLIILSFYVTKSGIYEEPGLFKFKNLVEDDDRAVRFTALAGQPASLVFDDGETNNFWFGEKVGLAQKPVLERADVIEYKRELLVQNKGELSAQEIDLGLSARCLSSDPDFSGSLASYGASGYEPKDYCNVWELEHNCPKTLAAQESCKATIRFTPPNQDPEWGFDQALEEIKYQAEIRATYESTPDGEDSALAGRFDTYSTSIEAKFGSSTKEIDFGEELTVGNFRKDLFKVKNEGYRAGALQALIFTKDQDGVYDGVDQAICIKDLSGDDYLTCYDSDLQNQLSLAQFPFVFKDRDACLVPAGEQEVQVSVDDGCIFNLRFQPSISYQTRKEFSYQLSVRYDSRRKGQVTIKERDLFKIKSRSLHAAKIEVAELKFDGTPVGLLGASADGDSPQLDERVDFGRLALLSPGYETWRNITITFQNVGGAQLDLYKAFSGIEGGENGLVELLKGVGKDLGPHAVKYFKEAMISAENCGSLGSIQSDPDLSNGNPSSQCAVTMSFAPVSMDTNLEQNQSMFDVLSAVPQKIFSFKYHDGSNFSDANIFSEEPDLAASSADNWKGESVGITAELIQKGFLADYSSVSGNLGQITRGETKYKNFILRNIGTGPITWIPYTGELLEHDSAVFYEKGLTRVDVPNPGIYGANYDCNDVIDFGYKGDDDDGDGTAATAADATSVQSRISSLTQLQKLETCVLRIKLADTNSMLRGVGSEPSLNRPVRSAALQNTLLSWELDQTHPEISLSLDFYDGDASGQPDSADDLAKTFGERFVTGSSHLKKELILKGNTKDMARLLPAFPTPYTSAVIYRPPYTLPQYSYYKDGVMETKNQDNISEAYFAAKNFYYLGTEENACVDFYSCQSYHFAGNAIDDNLAATGDSESSYDYLVHVGTFPKDTQVPFNFMVLNTGGSSATLTSETLVNQSSPAGNFFSFTSAHEDVLTPLGLMNGNIGANIGDNPRRSVKLVFEASQAGDYYADYLLEYNTGTPSQPTLTLKIRLLARVLDPIADLEMAVEDYDTEMGEALSGAPVDYTPGLGHAKSTQEVLYEAVRLNERSDSSPYMKKRVYVKNNTSVSMQGLHMEFRDSSPVGILSNKISMSDSGDIAIKVTSTNCPFSSPVDFAPGEECYVDVWYQPDTKDSQRSIHLAASFDVEPDPALYQYMQRNLSFRFSPKEPSVIRIAGAREENVRYKERGGDGTIISGQKAFILDFGTKVYNQEDPEYVFEKEVTNENTDTRASLLRQWEMHRGLSNTGYGPADITDYDSYGYTTIFQEGQIEVKANQTCLFGGATESGDETEAKGFNANTTEDCFLKIFYRPDFNMIGRQLSFTEVDDVSETYASLTYYNNKRNSVDKILISLTGKMHPPGSVLQDSANPYQDIEALPGASIGLAWSPMSAQAPILGPITGYRVYYTRYPGELGDVFKMMESSANFVDIYSGYDALINNSEIANLSSYYLKVVAIRQNSDYTAGNFPGLGSGRYLSFSQAGTIKVTVPSPEFLYDHQLNAFIPYNRLDGIYTYDEARSACAGLRPVYISDSGESAAKYFTLIDQQVWDFIESDFNFTSSYSDVSTMAHWIDTGLVYDIESIFGAETDPVYDPLASYQNFPGRGQAYFRPTEDMAAEYGTYMVAKTEGGLFGSAEYSGYESFMGPAYPEGVARCFIPLD